MAIVFTLAVLAGVILFGTLRLRANVRAQIFDRDAEVLDAVTRLEQLGAVSSADFARQLDDTGGQLALALRLSRLREGVLAARLFDPAGMMVAGLPVSVSSARLAPAELATLRQLQPLSRYEARARLEEFFLPVPGAPALADTRFPVLSVLIPIHAEGQTNLLAIAELLQEGGGIARQLARLDRHLAAQAMLAYAASGGVVLLVLSWAFRRLHRLGRELHAQAVSLRQANQELALAAKTSALGAVTAHVVHGLTSPLNGLSQFLSDHAGPDGEWDDVRQNAQRMQSLIGEIVHVLGEQSEALSYQLPMAELRQVLADRLQPVAQAAGVRFESHVAVEAALPNPAANLVLMILENLGRNALQATPRGKRVRLAILPAREGAVQCELADEGAGLPAAVQQGLFVPCRSTKPGGNGLGLALSQHLARHLGAELKLVRTGATGTTFALLLPDSVLAAENQPTQEPALQPG